MLVCVPPLLPDWRPQPWRLKIAPCARPSRVWRARYPVSPPSSLPPPPPVSRTPVTGCCAAAGCGIPAGGCRWARRPGYRLGGAVLASLRCNTTRTTPTCTTRSAAPPPVSAPACPPPASGWARRCRSLPVFPPSVSPLRLPASPFRPARLPRSNTAGEPRWAARPARRACCLSPPLVWRRRPLNCREWLLQPQPRLCTPSTPPSARTFGLSRHIAPTRRSDTPQPTRRPLIESRARSTCSGHARRSAPSAPSPRDSCALGLTLIWSSLSPRSVRPRRCPTILAFWRDATPYLRTLGRPHCRDACYNRRGSSPNRCESSPLWCPSSRSPHTSVSTAAHLSASTSALRPPHISAFTPTTLCCSPSASGLLSKPWCWCSSTFWSPETWTSPTWGASLRTECCCSSSASCRSWTSPPPRTRRSPRSAGSWSACSTTMASSLSQLRSASPWAPTTAGEALCIGCHGCTRACTCLMGAHVGEWRGGRRRGG
mmetsp:Transcript_36720/g.116907  ORF Transcript_36720/g.116907 Transcript_36720/m.116907 type:complete len:486 (-) Transcript_36720:3-1460(-)